MFIRKNTIFVTSWFRLCTLICLIFSLTPNPRKNMVTSMVLVLFNRLQSLFNPNIRFMHGVCCRTVHFILWHAFPKLLFRITPFNLFYCNSWTRSSQITTPYRTFIPCMKVDWDGHKSLSTILFKSLFATFVTSMKLIFNKHIALYCWMWHASLVFGKRIISSKFILNWVHHYGSCGTTIRSWPWWLLSHVDIFF
jgi:hypothetical protein